MLNFLDKVSGLACFARSTFNIKFLMNVYSITDLTFTIGSHNDFNQVMKQCDTVHLVVFMIQTVRKLETPITAGYQRLSVSPRGVSITRHWDI